MAKKYIAIGVDVYGDVVATEMGYDSTGDASASLQECFDNVVVRHIIEIEVSDKQPVKPTITKLKIN